MTQADYGFRRCTTCVMDTTDPGIVFDSKSVCAYCRNYADNILPNWHPDSSGRRHLDDLATKIRKQGAGMDFDCIIGVSGGPDSSYTAYVAKEIMGLRPLLFHVDAGWNTDKAVGNIEKLVDGLQVDLFTEIVNWEEVKDLQRAFLLAQVPDQDIQDIAFFSALYMFARKHRVKYVLTGANFSTECCREPEAWGAYPGIDKRLILDIHNRFGERPLETFPIVDILRYKVVYQHLLGMEVVKPLNLVPYVKTEAEGELESLFGWQPFKHKHHESRFTRFFEDFWLPRKFGFDKRKAHFSSLIMTGQMTRRAAIDRLQAPEMDEHFLTQEFSYVAAKLGFTTQELQNIFDGENKTCLDYKNKRWIIGLGTSVLRRTGIERRLMP